MSTNDVPGLRDDHGRNKNNDELAMGAWAEHEDESMIFVESVEDGRVVYSVFDFGGDEIVEYRDSMSEHGFKKAFSWKPDDGPYKPKRRRDAKGKFAKEDDDDDDFATPWTWHDKTPFPWDDVIEKGARAGGRHAHADHLMTAAERVARSRSKHGMKRRTFDYDAALTKAGSVGRAIVDKVQRAIGELGK